MDATSVKNISWQDEAKNLSQRVSLMWKKNFFTDFTIKVIGNNETREFKVNRVFLAIASPYFEGLFYGPFYNKCESTELNDIEPKHFYEFLSYIHTDKMGITCFDDARQMFILADRFLMPELKKITLEIIQTNSTLSNIFQAYEFYEFYSMKAEAKNAAEAITLNTSAVISSPKFLEIQKETLIWLLKQDALNIVSEIELYNAVDKWIKAEQENKGNSTDEDKSENWWSDIIHNIRFLSMSAEEFSCGPVLHPYISKEDKLAFLSKLSCSKSPVEFPQKFCNRPRSLLDQSTRFNQGQDGNFSDDSEDYSIADYRLPSNWRSRLYTAVQVGDMDQLITLYQQGADINAKYGKNRRSLLHVAATFGVYDSVDWLVSHGLDINSANLWGWTALHFASREGNVDTVRYLLHNGARADIYTNKNKNAYDVACDHIKQIYDFEFPGCF